MREPAPWPQPQTPEATYKHQPTPSWQRPYEGRPLQSDQLAAYVQLRMLWVETVPPVPAVKPTKAVFPPTVPGISMAREPVNIAPVTVSVSVNVRVAPS